MSADALSRAERINVLLAEWRQVVVGTSSRLPSALVGLRAENPYWTIKGVAGRLDVACQPRLRPADRTKLGRSRKSG